MHIFQEIYAAEFKQSQMKYQVPYLMEIVLVLKNEYRYRLWNCTCANGMVKIVARTGCCDGKIRGRLQNEYTAPSHFRDNYKPALDNLGVLITSDYYLWILQAERSVSAKKWRHAILVYAFNSKKEPLLRLFLSTWLGTHASTMSRDVPDIHWDQADFCQCR